MVVTEGLSFDILRKDVLTTLRWAEGPTAQKCKTSKRLSYWIKHPENSGSSETSTDCGRNVACLKRNLSAWRHVTYKYVALTNLRVQQFRFSLSFRCSKRPSSYDT